MSSPTILKLFFSKDGIRSTPLKKLPPSSLLYSVILNSLRGCINIPILSESISHFFSAQESSRINLEEIILDSNNFFFFSGEEADFCRLLEQNILYRILKRLSVILFTQIFKNMTARFIQDRDNPSDAASPGGIYLRKRGPWTTKVEESCFPIFPV